MSWEENKQYILSILEDNKEDHKDMFVCLTKIREDIAGLKVKSTIWGALGGSVPFLLGIITWLIKEKI